MDEITKERIDENKVIVQKPQANKQYPVGCLRGVLIFLLGLFVSIMIGIASGQSIGVLWGIVIGTVAFIICVTIVAVIINRSKTLTIVDCGLPFLISVFAAFAFAPIAIFSGNIISIGTCIFSGVLLSIGLILYRLDKIQGALLVLPMLTFIYEILPIDLPSDLDNILALSTSTLELVVGSSWNYIKQLKKLGK